MNIRLEIAGADEASRKLRGTAEQLAKDPRPLLEALAAEMQTLFQGHIREAKGPDGDWPELADATHHIRAHYGWGAGGPKGIRAGDLLHSITTLRLGDDFVDVGTNLSYSRTMQEGGEVTDERGHTRSVQAFPFVWLSDSNVRDFVELIRGYYLGGVAGAPA
jgi:phage gpG-like protein